MENAFIIAVQSGNVAEIAHLITTKKVAADAPLFDGYAAVHEAARRGDVDVLVCLRGLGARLDATLGTDKSLPLHLAASAGHTTPIIWMLTEGGLGDFFGDKGSAVSKRNAKGESPVDCAVGAGHLGPLKVLCKYGAQLDGVNGERLMHTACRQGYKDIILWLQDYCGDLPTEEEISLARDARSKNAGFPGLQEHEIATFCDSLQQSRRFANAVNRGELAEVTRIVRKLGADVDARVFGEGCSAAHVSATNGNMLMLRCLQKLSADLSARDFFGNTTLHCAASAGHIPIIQWMVLKGGLRVNARDHRGDTAAHSAVVTGQLEALKCLTALGTDLMSDVPGAVSVMRLACGFGQKTIFKWLLEEQGLFPTADDMERGTETDRLFKMGKFRRSMPHSRFMHLISSMTRNQNLTERPVEKMSCAFCASDRAVKQCGCGTQRYCGPDCHSRHWQSHKIYCRRARNASGKVLS